VWPEPQFSGAHVMQLIRADVATPLAPDEFTV
jgi:hypothetical protein